MCEKTEDTYLDGEVVWVKLGSCWWPGEVVGSEKLPPDLLPSFRKPPIAVVKFFQEDTYEYVKNNNAIHKYNCSQKNEFINKGLYMFRTKHGHMEKFPEDIIRAETAIGGDIEILTRDEFQQKKKENYSSIFGDPKKKLAASAGKAKRGRTTESPRTPFRKNIEKADYKVHILLQGSKPTPPSDTPPAEPMVVPSTSVETEPDNQHDDTPNEPTEATESKPKPTSTVSTPVASSSGIYACHACAFSTTRLNVLILHNKSHSVSFTSYTPSPVRKKPSPKLPTKSPSAITKTPKVRKPRKEKPEQVPKKLIQSSKKRAAPQDAISTESKKVKTDEEIKSSLLADWDDGDEESNDESSTMVMAASPEVPEATESPAVPTSAELTSASAEISSPTEKKPDSLPTAEKPESSSDCKYEFCEDEDWPLEADAGRKIPRVKNAKRKENAKSISLDEDDVAREVAELLNKTTMPELPSAPEPLKVEENFPEPSIVKSPDKQDKPAVPDKPPGTPTTKAIFKTKTFFRSRHSRSQDAIGKYVAEQLNAVERMDIADSDMNGSEVASSPETHESPPVEHVKVARLAPKIQLKKMKAELALKEKDHLEHLGDASDLNQFGDIAFNVTSPPLKTYSSNIKEKEDRSKDVFFPTQEIKPVNADVCDQVKSVPTKKDSAEEVTTDLIEETIPKPTESESNVVESSVEDVKCSEAEVQAAIEEPVASYMNDTTASAVDALLSVSRDADRVTRVISDDPPEDLFEDDNKESEVCNNDINGFSENINMEIEMNKKEESEVNKYLKKDSELKSNLNEFSMDYDKVDEPENETINITEKIYESQNAIDEVNEIVLTGTNETVLTETNETVLTETNEMELTETNETELTETNETELTETNETELTETNETVLTESNEMVLTDTNEIESNMEVSHTNIIEDLPEPNFEEEIVETETVTESPPSESVLQIAETLISLPSTAVQSKTSTDFQTEHYSLSLSNENSQETTSCESLILDSVDEKVPKKIEEVKVTQKSKSLLISNNENINARFETEEEKSENLTAAQSLVQMSESVDLKMGIEPNITPSSVNSKELPKKAFNLKQNNGFDNLTTVEHKMSMMSNDNRSETSNGKSVKVDSSSSNLLRILEEPSISRKSSPMKSTLNKQIIQGKEKILNFDVAKTLFKGKPESPKQKIIIRRTGTATNKSIINNITDISSSPDKIILSRSNNPAQDGSVQTFTIQTSPDIQSDANTIIIQQKIRKFSKPPAKLQKIKPQTSLIAPMNETSKIINAAANDDAMFDINSMPVVLSEDLLTPESIDKMPILISQTDSNIINPSPAPTPPKLVKSKQIIETEKMPKNVQPSKPEVKTLLMNPVNEMNKATTPNILSKSSKLRGGKPMLVIDKTTGKQKIIMAKSEPAVKEIKPAPTLIQSVSQTTNKAEKFIILPTTNSSRPGRTQKIVIDPQTGKAHVLVSKGPEPQIHESKPAPTKLIPSSTVGQPGNTVMIITNAQGAQSRIVLTPEHEKMLFPKKHQPNLSQLKSITHRITTSASTSPKTLVTPLTQAKPQDISPGRSQTRIVPKQKSAIITSKGQLIVGGRVATTAQNIAPMPEIRPALKRIITTEPKKLVQTIQKTNSEPIIFLQQKSGAVMQLTAAQFEHLQRTGQIVQKPPIVQENKMVVQKNLTLAPNETSTIMGPKPRIRKTVTESPTPAKKLKQVRAVPAPPPAALPLPALTPFVTHVPSLVTHAPTHVTHMPSHVTHVPPHVTHVPSLVTHVPALVPAASNTVSIATSSSYSEFENFEELLPSTAIARQMEPPVEAGPAVAPPPAAVAPPPSAPPPAPSGEAAAVLPDAQLLAVPGEHFCGPPGSFYLCVEDNGTLTPIDNRPLMLENNQLVPMAIEPVPVLVAQPERRDILEAALANSDVFHADPPSEAPDFRDLNASVSVHCRVSETSTTLNQPIMTPVEMPSKTDVEPTVPSNLEDGLAVIGVTAASVPTSLELPITVTDPRIAPAKTTDPLSRNNYGTTLLPSPNTEMSYVTTEEVDMPMGGPISMPLLTDDESVGKSMPILTDEIAERAVSSVESTMESTVGSPSSADVRESEAEEGGAWERRLLTPNSDTSEASSEIPLQPHIQLSVADLPHS